MADEELNELLEAMEGDPDIPKYQTPSIAVSEPVSRQAIESKMPKVISDEPVRPKLPVVSDKPLPLTRQQELNIAFLSYKLFVANEAVTPDAIRKQWPTNPELAHKAGKRPSLTAIQRHMMRDIYTQDMLKHGVTVEEDLPVGESNGLTAEQISVISHLTDTTTTKGIPSRLKELGIKPVTYRAWLRQKPFNDAIKKLAGNALTDAIPMAETMLATQAQAGDLRAIKFLFEVTGRHDPMRQQQVDTQALIAVMIDCIQQVLGQHPELLKELIDQISIQSKGVKGVLG